MFDSLFKKVCLVLTLYVITEGGFLTHARVFSPCELASILRKHEVQLSLSKLTDWICLADAASGYNSSKVGRIDNSFGWNSQYGIFQLSTYFYDKNKQENNECLLNRTQLVDDDLEDDIRCVKLIYRSRGDTFEQWGSLFSKNCGNSTAYDKLLKDCDVLNGSLAFKGNAPKVTTKEANVCPDRIYFPANNGKPSHYCSLETSCDAQKNVTISVPHLTDCWDEKVLSPGSSWFVLGIVLAVSSTAVIILVITTTVYWTCLKEYSGLSRPEINAFENGNGTNYDEKTPELEFVYETLVDQPYNKEFEIAKSDLIFDRTEVLGTGQYGIVYKGTYRGKPVGIKSIKSGAGKTCLEALLVELKVMIYIRGHKNVVELIGACTRELHNGSVYVVIEYCPLGSLLGFLKRYREEFGSTIGKDAARKFQHYDKLPGSENGPIYELQMIGWCYQIAAAMEYLTSKKVIHGDLAARNILMLDPQNIKITDFGLSRKLYDYATYIQAADKEPLPFRWLALETLLDLKFSTASDAWSYGITLWEIFSLGQVPYPGLSWSLDFVQRLEAGLRMTKPNFASDSIYSIMADCWNVNPTKRPNFSLIRQNIFQELKQLCQSVRMRYGKFVTLDSDMANIPTFSLCPFEFQEYIDSDQLHLITGLDLCVYK